MLRKLNDDHLTLHAHIPILGRVSGSVHRHALEHRALRLFRIPRREGELIGMDQRELPALERTGDRKPVDLLPIAPCLVVAHDEVLVVDAGQMERQPQARHISRPHQTGVTERSIGGGDRRPSDHVIDDMVVSHDEDRVRALAPIFTTISLSSLSSFTSAAAANAGWSTGWNINSNTFTRASAARTHTNIAPSVTSVRRHHRDCARQYAIAAQTARSAETAVITGRKRKTASAAVSSRAPCARNGRIT